MGEMTFEYPAIMKLRPVLQQTVMASRMRNSVTFSNCTMIERDACTAVRSSASCGLSLEVPRWVAWVISVGHELSCSSASGVKNCESSAASVNTSFQLLTRESSESGASRSATTDGSICMDSTAGRMPSLALAVSKSRKVI